MCYTCGCRMPYDDMGSKDNITEEYFKKAGATSAISKAGVKKAKQNMIELLKAEIEADDLAKPKQSY